MALLLDDLLWQEYQAERQRQGDRFVIDLDRFMAMTITSEARSVEAGRFVQLVPRREHETE